MSSGVFVTFEGCEGSGKSTQVQRLAARLNAQHVPCIVTREPGGTPLADDLRHLLARFTDTGIDSKTELLMVLAARSHHVESVIRPALAAKKVVLCDRFSDSTFAYQGAGRGLDRDTITLLNNYATGDLTPDLTFLVDVEVEVGVARLKSSNRNLDRWEREDPTFHRRVCDGYRDLAAAQPDRFVVIRGDRSENEVADEIYTALWNAYPTLCKEP